MTVGRDELERLLKRYLATGATVVVILLTPTPVTPPATTTPTTTAVPEDTATSETTAPTTTAAPPTGPTAAATQNWGTPTRVEEFDSGTGGWQLYEGPGHAGRGQRSPAAVSVRGGVLTITGDPSGTTGGMAWGQGRRYGRWEARVRAPAADPSYSAVLLLWPDAEDWPRAGRSTSWS